MNRLLGKRIPRDFLSNIGRYIALIFLIAMGIFIVVSRWEQQILLFSEQKIIKA